MSDSFQAADVSIVIPVRDYASGIERCVAAAVAQDAPALEIIVSDDGSVDGSGDIARACGAEIVRSERSRGPGEARNAGVRRAAGKILLFLDSDVIAPPTLVGRVVSCLNADSNPVAVFGSYDDRPSAAGTVSQFRNLLHHYTHQNADAEATTFWSGCGAVRRDAFEQVGGFLTRWDGVEDIELGYRLRAAGGRVLLDHGLQVTHLKRWTLRSMIATDFSLRALQWSRLIRSSGIAPDHLNVRASQRWSVALAAAAVPAIAASLAWPAALPAALACLAGIVVLNRHFYAFLAQKRGLRFAITAVPLHFCYFLTAGAGYACALLEGRVFRRSNRTTE